MFNLQDILKTLIYGHAYRPTLSSSVARDIKLRCVILVFDEKYDVKGF